MSLVATRLGLTWVVEDDPLSLGVDHLCGLALRINPRRAHLVVSKVLAKHIPARPSAVLDAGHQLAALIDLPADRPALVIGFCETATGLGHAVAEGLPAASYVHTTRRPMPLGPIAVDFQEEHSHAAHHFLQPVEGLLDGDGPLVLVDDELTTGTTALNLLAALDRQWPRERYVLAALLDARTAEARAAFEARAADLGLEVQVVSLLRASLDLPTDVLRRAAPWQGELAALAPAVAGGGSSVAVHHRPAWPREVPIGGRHGFTPSDRSGFDAAIKVVVAELLPTLAPSARVLVLGVEELMHAPVRIAHGLEQAGIDVLVQSTSRSPVLALDDPGYAIRHKLTFPSPDDPSRRSHVYNVGPEVAYTDIVVVSEDVECLGLVEALRPWATHAVHVLPLRPAFGSYAPEDVTWLLTDLTAVDLELGTGEREAAIQAGRSYAEMLPVEFQPDEAYTALFHATLQQSAERLAVAVGVVGELILQRQADPVLVSLARAGIPIGILLRRWMKWAHNLDVPHYTISIVRGRGIDEVAVAHILARHRPEQIRFVDGWTGKGAIARELAVALEAFPGVDPELAVLADPGSCTTLFGTRDDFLIPSASLNSTVSGLVSRTVLRDDLIGPGMFHGAKSYGELAPHDVSAVFLDAVTAAFAPVEVPDVDRTPTWSGWHDVEAIVAELGLPSINLAKPGVGETTRVLLRRVPEQILIRPDRAADLQHVLMLAQARGVAVVERTDLTYSCVGIIRPVSR